MRIEEEEGEDGLTHEERDEIKLPFKSAIICIKMLLFPEVATGHTTKRKS